MTIAYAVGSNLYVNITNKCPCSCTFCIRKNGDGVYGSDSLWLEHEPSAQEIIDALEKADFKKYDEIIFCGYGEPTERIECLAEIADYIKKNSDKKIRLNTNGLSDLIHGKDTACMLENRIDTVSISLNAGTIDEYLKVTRPRFGEPSFEAMQKFATDCKKYVKNVAFTVVDVIGEDEINAAKSLSEKLGVPLRIRKYEG
ncbi:MAG: TIGR04100 family radical SAM protein [Oscillospiraceae bacterium]|nr:TIGR04100 family radical SAM protein [Oscillospiraceae bacterium]